MEKVLSNKKVILALVLPGLFLFFSSVFFPIVLSAYYGMTDSTGAGKPNFIGLENYIELFTKDKIFWISLWHAILLGLGYILLQHPVCVVVALMLDRVSGKLEKFFRAVYFVPSVISVVVVTKMWVFVYNPQFGLLNTLLEKIGLGFLKQQWLGDIRIAFPCVLVMTIWIGFGWGLLMYYTGIKGIPEDIYEAARIDGASGMKLHTKITVPLLTPIIKVNVIFAMINALKQMEIVYLSTDGGPANATQFVANYLYSKAFLSSQYGYANAISVVFAVICLIITVAFTKLLNRDTGIA